LLTSNIVAQRQQWICGGDVWKIATFDQYMATP